MKVLILEDETLAADRIRKMIGEIDHTIEILADIKSVEEGERWFKENDEPDLIISDIRLLDGLSFDLFKKINIEAPVIFTTAYDQYAIKAFEVNSIDYLLKPIQKEKLQTSIEKHIKRTQDNKFPADFSSLYDLIQTQKKAYKSRFMIKAGQKILALPVEKVAYFFSQHKLTYAVTKEDKKYPIDQPLEVVDSQLDPKQFFRANRQYIISIDSIGEIHPYFKGRMKVTLNPAAEEDITISSEKTPEFKHWLDM